MTDQATRRELKRLNAAERSKRLAQERIDAALELLHQAAQLANQAAERLIALKVKSKYFNRACKLTKSITDFRLELEELNQPGLQVDNAALELDARRTQRGK